MLWTSLVCCVCSHEISQRWKLEQFRSHDPTTQNVTMSSHNVLNFKTSELWNHISTCHLLLKFKCKMSMLCCVQYWSTAAVSAVSAACSRESGVADSSTCPLNDRRVGSSFTKVGFTLVPQILRPRNVRRILVRGSMPPCRLRRRKFRKFDYEMVHSEVYMNKYVINIAPFSTPACPDCPQNIT